jgi:hypothetical protein
MERYRIVPAHRAYKVVMVELGGHITVLRTWPTEEAAISHLKYLKALREDSEHAIYQSHHRGEKDWRG